MEDNRPRDPLTGDLITRRAPDRSTEGDRRRGNWAQFRRAYPGFIFTVGVALMFMVGVDMWLIYRRLDYSHDISVMRGHMSGAEKQKTDLIVANTENKVRLAFELAKRQARLDKRLHLNVSVDSAKMYLEREGAVLREMPIQLGPERAVTAGSDSIPVAVPRGERTVAEVGADRIVLNGGTYILSSAGGKLLGDSTAVPAGAIRVGREDLEAIRPNLSAGMKVYFY